MQYLDIRGAYQTWPLMQGMQSATAAALQRQFVHISAAMHDYLRQAKDPMPAAVQATVVRVFLIQVNPDNFRVL